MIVTAAAAQKRLPELLEAVNRDATEVEILSPAGSAFLVNADDYTALKESVYLLRPSANSAHLASAAEQVRRGNKDVSAPKH